MGRRPRKTLLLVALATLAGVLVLPFVAANHFVERYRAEVDADVRSQLEVISATSARSVDLWTEGQKAVANQLLEDPDLQRAARDLLAPPGGSPATATDRTALEEAIAAHAPITHHLTFLLSDPTGEVVAAQEDRWVGQTDPIHGAVRLTDQLAQGRVAVGPPLAGGMDLLRDGAWRPDQPALVVAIPVTEPAGGLLGRLLLVVDPAAQLTASVELARPGNTGETYLVDGQGHMLSPSRFMPRTDWLAGLPIQVAPPGAEAGTLTRAATDLRAGLSGQSLDAYDDYRGVPVVGAWRWSEGTGVGVVTELDAAEAFAKAEGLCTLLYGLAVASDALLLLVGLLLLRQGSLERRARAELQSIVDAAPVPISVVDGQQRILRANRAAARVLGADQHQLIGRTLDDVLPEELWSATVPAHTAALAGEGVVHSDERAPTPNGLRMYRVVRTKVPIGGSDAVCAVSVDITEQLQALQEQQRLNAALKESYEKLEDRVKARTRELEEATAARSEFLARMSHELRTPLSGVLGLLELANAERLPESVGAYIHRAHGAAQTLRGLINEVLDFSKIEASGIQLEAIPFDLREVLEPLAAIVLGGPYAGQVELFIHLHPGVPSRIIGDPTRLRQALTNLVGNATKFTERGHIVVVVEPIDDTTGDDLHLAFRVEDSGVGFDPSHAKRLFQPFSQADGSITRRYGGTGLGLAITQAIVEAMGGNIRATSVPGEGSVFAFDVHVRQSSVAGMPSAASIQRALVVDDEALARLVACDHLAALGVPTEQASDGVDALRRTLEAEAAGSPYEALIVDQHMPGMTGTQVARAVREMARDGTLSVAPICVLITGGKDESAPFDCDENLEGVDVRVSKPVYRTALEDALRALGAETHSLPAEDTVSRYPSARVLIAEDNEVLRMVAFGLLERHGIVPTFAEDGAEAVLLTTQQPFDLIFMDVHMPRMDGFEATALIKRQHGDSIPIIAMTADVLPETATRLQQAGVVGSVPKPVVPELLAEALARHLPHLAQTRATPSPDTGDIRSAG